MVACAAPSNSNRISTSCSPGCSQLPGLVDTFLATVNFLRLTFWACASPVECLSCGGETARCGMSCGALEPHAAGGGLCHRRSRRCRRPDKEAELAQNNVMASCLQKRPVCQLAVALKTGHAYLRIRTTKALCAVYQESDLAKATVTAVAKKKKKKKGI